MDEQDRLTEEAMVGRVWLAVELAESDDVGEGVVEGGAGNGVLVDVAEGLSVATTTNVDTDPSYKRALKLRVILRMHRAFDSQTCESHIIVPWVTNGQVTLAAPPVADVGCTVVLQSLPDIHTNSGGTCRKSLIITAPLTQRSLDTTHRSKPHEGTEGCCPTADAASQQLRRTDGYALRDNYKAFRLVVLAMKHHHGRDRAHLARWKNGSYSCITSVSDPENRPIPIRRLGCLQPRP